MNVPNAISFGLDAIEVIGAGVGLFAYLQPAMDNFELVLREMDDPTCGATATHHAGKGTELLPCLYTSCYPPNSTQPTIYGDDVNREIETLVFHLIEWVGARASWSHAAAASSCTRSGDRNRNSTWPLRDRFRSRDHSSWLRW